MAGEMPECKKCGQLHWYFKPCTEGITRKRVGYDTLQQQGEYSPPRNNKTGYQALLKGSDYQRVQGREAQRVHHKEDH